MAYSECKLPMSLFKTTYQSTTKLIFALIFGQYVQLITIDWADQTNNMAQQM